MSVKVRMRDGHPQYDITGTYPDGTVYRLRRQSHLGTLSTTLRWAEQRERELLEEWNKKRHGIVESPTLALFWSRFLDGYVHANGHKPGGIENKRIMWEAHIKPELGDLRIDEITAERVQLFKASLQKKIAHRRTTPLSAKSVNNVLTVLSKMLRTAVEWGDVSRAPAVKMLRRQKRVMRYHSATVYADMCHAAALIGPEALAIVRLGGDGGLRLGEILGLLWADVDESLRAVMVQRSDYQGEEIATKGMQARWLPLTPELWTVLESVPRRGARVLTRKDGTPYTKKAVHYLLRQVKKRMTNPVDGLTHVLRHTCASHMVSGGASLYAVQNWLGHADPKTTQGYAHLAPAALNAAMDGMKKHREQPVHKFGTVVERTG